MVGFGASPERWEEDSVDDHKQKRAKEILASSDEESAEGVRKWLEEFLDENDELVV